MVKEHGSRCKMKMKSLSIYREKVSGSKMFLNIFAPYFSTYSWTNIFSIDLIFGRDLFVIPHHCPTRNGAHFWTRFPASFAVYFAAELGLRKTSVMPPDWNFSNSVDPSLAWFAHHLCIRRSKSPITISVSVFSLPSCEYLDTFRVGLFESSSAISPAQ